jgi:hypothetical protein
MRSLQPLGQKSDGECIDFEPQQPGDCPTCGRRLRRFGRGAAGCTHFDLECPNCGVVTNTRKPAATDSPQIVADGSGNAYDVLAQMGDPEGHSDALQAYLDDEILVYQLDIQDVVRPLELALGRLCIKFDHEKVDEWIFYRDSEHGAPFVALTTDALDNPMRVTIDEETIEDRITHGKVLEIHLTKSLPVEPPRSAAEPPEGILEPDATGKRGVSQ